MTFLDLNYPVPRHNWCIAICISV